MRLRAWLTLSLCLLVVGCAGNRTPAPAPGPDQPSAPVAPAPVSANFTLKEVASGLTRPLQLTHAGDDRLFVVEQTGRIRIIKDGKLLPTPFLDVSAKLTTKGNEQGLLGLAFHPDYARNGTFFVHYSGSNAGETVIARYKVSADNPDRADAASEKVIFTEPQPFSNHNGGPIVFGPDKYLYIALGDGGNAGDPGNRAQNLDSFLGKLLRIDVNADTYKVPPDNPFVGKPGKDEIWAYGLRNPWRVSFDRATGNLYIADVGQNKWEEINFQPAGSKGGENYGWKVYEGLVKYSPGEAPGAVPPVTVYSHDHGCSVTGGFVYRGKEIPGLVGTYLYGDYCTGKMWGLQRSGAEWKATELPKVDFNISSFGEDHAGEMYVVDHGGKVYRMVAK